MKKKIIGLLCLTMIVTGSVGCAGTAGSDSQETAAAAEEATEEPTEEATAEPTEEAAAEETEEPAGEKAPEEEFVPPVEFDASAPVEKGAHIAVVVKEAGSGYWKNMEKHMQEAVDYVNLQCGFEGEDEITLTVEGPDDEEDVNSQINIIDAVLAENPSVLCLAAIDVDSCEAQLESARENGIPVIMFDSSVTSDLVHVFCGTDNRKAGRLAADKLCEGVDDAGEVAVFAHERITQTSRDRVKGFRKRIRNSHPGVSLVSVVYDDEEKDETDEAETDMEDVIRGVLDEHTSLKGIFCTNGTVAGEVLDVLEDYPDREIQVVGFDSGKDQIKAIGEGREYGVVAQDTYTMAYRTIYAAAAAGAGKKAPQETVYVPHVWIDSGNLDSEENENILYE